MLVMILWKNNKTLRNSSSNFSKSNFSNGNWLAVCLSKTLMPAVKLDVFTKPSGKSISMNELLLPFEIRPEEIFVSALVSLRLLEETKTRGRNEKKTIFKLPASSWSKALSYKEKSNSDHNVDRS
ncbi:MAG: hypothetical protein WCF23_08030 [Candidatus Nitrosopolaris sp.]